MMREKLVRTGKVLLKSGKAAFEPKISWHRAWIRYHENRITRSADAVKQEMSSENLILTGSIIRHAKKKEWHGEKLRYRLEVKKARLELFEERRGKTWAEKRKENKELEKMGKFNDMHTMSPLDFPKVYQLATNGVTYIVLATVIAIGGAGISWALGSRQPDHQKLPEKIKTTMTYPDTTKQ